MTVSRDIIPELINGFGIKPSKLLTINNFFEIAQIEVKSKEPLTVAEAVVYSTAPMLVTSGRLTLKQIIFTELLCRFVAAATGQACFCGRWRAT